MRAIALFAIAILLTNCGASAQQIHWQLIHSENTPAGWATFTHVSAPDNDHVVVVGSYTGSSFLKMSTDGGATWKQSLRDTGAPTDLPGFNSPPLIYWDIAVPTPRLVLVASDSGIIFRSTDWGEEWQRVDMGGPSSLSLSMSDSLFAVVVQRGNRIRTSSDGGAHWDVVAADTTNWLGYTLLRVEAVTSTHWVAHLNKFPAPPMLARTTDAGLTWRSVTVPVTHISSIAMVDAQLGYAVGIKVPPGQHDNDPRGNDIVLRTTDGGTSWKTSLDERIDPPFGLLAGAFATASHGLAVGYNRKILVTSDGGTTWHLSVDGLPPDDKSVLAVNQVACPSAQVAYVATMHGELYKAGLTSGTPPFGSRAIINGQLIKELMMFEHGISLALEQNNGVSIELFDGLGERRNEIALERVMSGQRIDIPTVDLPSGVYLLRIRSGERIECRSFVLGP